MARRKTKRNLIDMNVPLEPEHLWLKRMEKQLELSKRRQRWVFYHEEKDVFLVGRWNKTMRLTLKDPTGEVQEKFKYKYIKGEDHIGSIHWLGII